MPEPSAPSIQRHYGLDWLRIGAFGQLILFHTAAYFAPGHWVVKSPQTVAWAAWPMAASSPWRLSMLFAVSGFATAAMIQRHPSLGAFFVERSKRLLIPLLFGMLVIVPPQGWVLLAVAGIELPFATYLRDDAFSFSNHVGVFFPAWEHLWFLPYLWAYTTVLVGILCLSPEWRMPFKYVVSWISSGRRLIWGPAAAVVLGTIDLSRLHVPGLTENAAYIPAFVFGFAYAHVAQLRTALTRNFRWALAASLGALAAIWLNMAFDAALPPDVGVVIGMIASGVMSWTMVLVAFYLADRYLNRDNRWRAPLAAAVFPAYIVHQTVIVMVGWQLRQADVVGFPALAAQLAAVSLAIWVAWLLARAFPAVGLVLGMPHKHRPRRERPGFTPNLEAG